MSNAEAASRRRSAPPTDEQAVANRIGPKLLDDLVGVLGSARLYDPAHQAVQSQIERFLRSVDGAIEEELSIVTIGEHFYLNGARIKLRASQSTRARALATELQARGLGGLRFHDGLARAEFETFLRLFVAATDAQQGERLGEAAAAQNVTRVGVVLESEVAPQTANEKADPAAECRDERARARETYLRAVAGSRALMEHAARTGRPALRQARRVVQPVVDALMNDECGLLGFMALKKHDEYTFAHCVNVSMLSVAIGRRLGLSRTALASLGVAGLLHDLGKLAVPPEILRKADRLSPEEWRVVQRHPLEGLKLVGRLPSLSASAVDAMHVCLQHHQTQDRKGYPEFACEWRQSSLARIVAGADCYDAMTGHRSYRRRPMTGFEALQQLLGREASRFDPAVLWALVRSVGLYPAGTVMLTSSGHTVVSLGPNPADARRPACRVLRRRGGESPVPDAEADWDPMPATESVSRVISPEEMEVDLDACLCG